MSANKRTIYLTKNHQLHGTEDASTNVFLFNENGPAVQAKWVRKNIELNDGCFVILDHKQAILKEAERNLLKRNYYIEKIDFSNMVDKLSINPFDLVKDTSEIHFMFLNFLHAMWDNSDPDIAAMSNLIDAFASCIFFMFSTQKEKLNMVTLRKMVYSVRATCQTDDGVVPLSDAIFAGIKDQESMPCKYYAQFKKAAGERQEEVAEKVAQVFDMFNDNDMAMMSETDEYLKDVFNFKTAIFVNVNNENEEHSGKLMMILLNYFIQRVAEHSHVLFVLDDIDAKRSFASLPYWMKESAEYDMTFLVINDDLAEFQSTPRTEKYFRNLQKVVAASVLIHHNDAALKFADDLPMDGDEMNEFTDQDCIATVLVPAEELSNQDELF
jgi:molybdopterin converting factor small subunit